jgi:hypothetical protein
MQRIETASVDPPPGAADPVAIKIVAMKFRTNSAVDFGHDFHFITLQSERGGPASTGTKNTLNFALRISSPDGQIVQSASHTSFLNPPEEWMLQHVPHWPHVRRIDGVNQLLNGEDRSQDFRYARLHEYFFESPRGSVHWFHPALPAPGALGLLAFGELAQRRWRTAYCVR